MRIDHYFSYFCAFIGTIKQKQLAIWQKTTLHFCRLRGCKFSYSFYFTTKFTTRFGT